MPNIDIKNAIEAILFVAGSPVSGAELAKLLESSQAEIESALEKLELEYRDSGLVITKSHGSYQLATHPEVSQAVKNYLQGQLREKLTEAAIETLSIVAYKQPVSRTEIEAIRGVNSQYTLRLILQRGLVEKITDPKDARIILYRTTHEFLQHLGIRDVRELPDFESIVKELRPADNPSDV